MQLFESSLIAYPSEQCAQNGPTPYFLKLYILKLGINVLYICSYPGLL